MFEIKEMSDAHYFGIGTVDIFKPKELVVSNSWLKKVFNNGLYDVLIAPDEVIDDDLQVIFDVGSAFHCFVLEKEEFYKRYYIAEGNDPIDTRVRITPDDFDFIEKVHKNISMKYPEILDGEYTELVILGEVDGVKTKSKLDKIIMYADGKVDIIDLKSVYYDFMMKKSSDGTQYKLRKQITDQDYDLQAYFYTRQVKEWLDENNRDSTRVSFSLLLASKDTFDVKMYKMGEEIMESGRLKFESVWEDVVDFVKNGADSVNRFDTL